MLAVKLQAGLLGFDYQQVQAVQWILRALPHRGRGGVKECEREDDHNLQLNSGKQSSSVIFMPFCYPRARVRGRYL